MIQNSKILEVSKEELQILITNIGEKKMKNGMIQFCQEEPSFSKYRPDGTYWKGFRMEYIGLDRIVLFYYQLLKEQNSKIIERLKNNIYQFLDIEEEESVQSIQNKILNQKDTSLVSILLRLFDISYDVPFQECQMKMKEVELKYKQEIETLKSEYENTVQNLRKEIAQGKNQNIQLQTENERLKRVWTNIQSGLSTMDSQSIFQNIQDLKIENKNQLQNVLENLLKSNFTKYVQGENLESTFVMEYVLYKMMEEIE